jgi:hypothetical protein
MVFFDLVADFIAALVAIVLELLTILDAVSMVARKSSICDGLACCGTITDRWSIAHTRATTRAKAWTSGRK